MMHSLFSAHFPPISHCEPPECKLDERICSIFTYQFGCKDTLFLQISKLFRKKQQKVILSSYACFEIVSQRCFPLGDDERSDIMLGMFTGSIMYS